MIQNQIQFVLRRPGARPPGWVQKMGPIFSRIWVPSTLACTVQPNSNSFGGPESETSHLQRSYKKPERNMNAVRISVVRGEK